MLVSDHVRAVPPTAIPEGCSGYRATRVCLGFVRLKASEQSFPAGLGTCMWAL